MAEPRDEWLTGRQVGPWRIGAFLARGGMASVWLAEHQRGGIDAVIKVPLGTDADSLARASREGTIQSALHHPNVVRALDLVDVEGRPGIVLERIGGGLALDGFLRAGPMTEVDRTAIYRGVVAGVEAAHSAGYIHRDLKPGNVLLLGDPGAFVAKLADFGLARLEHEPTGQKLTRAGYILGSAAYMAPEQARDAGGVDARADTWSVGCILYELWAGVPAFPGDRVDEVLANVVAGRYTPLDVVVPEVPARVLLAVEACLQVDPEQRPRDASELREILDGNKKWVAGAGSARRPSLPPRPARSLPPTEANTTFVAEISPPPRRQWTALLAALFFTAAALGWWWLT